jgi:hypothetical protein
MRLTKVMHAITHALNVLNIVDNSNACSSARDSDLSGFTFNTAYTFSYIQNMSSDHTKILAFIKITDRLLHCGV